MNLTHVLFSPNGRIGQQEFWIGVLIIVGGNLFLTWLPFIGMIIWLALLYIGVCVFGKRLHDAGRSAWLHGAVWLVQIALTIVGFMIAGGAVLAAVTSGGGDEAAIMAAIGASGGLFLVFGLGLLIWIVYTIWVGVAASDPNDNRFGPAAGNVAHVFSPDPAAPAAPAAPETPSEPPAADTPASGDTPSADNTEPKP
ncbi:DUF805 domain-containing protein [Hyphobacterium sp.]|uniref:DUF805 domain-containing protein n=1 Tax=Hyphobacterium sp. TaxID=2004662 RepID=UPI003BAA5306